MSKYRFGLVAVLIGLSLIPGCESDRDLSEERNPDPAGEWFLAARRTEEGTLPVRALGRALDTWVTQGGGTDAAVGSWVNTGPSNIGGRISSLAQDPNDVDRVWLGTGDGGVFLSSDAGDNWTPVFDDQTSLSIGALATHPTDSDIVWVGTGEEAGGGYSYGGEGVFRTDDSGAGWTSQGLAATRRIGRIAVDPANPDRVFVAAVGGLYQRDTNRGLYRSTDGGTNWSQVLFIADDTGVVDVAIDPSDPQRIYASSYQRFRGNNESRFGGTESGIWRSIDGGDNWNRLTTGLPSSAGRIGLAIAPSNPDRIVAIVGSTAGGLDGIYRSENGGDNWSKVNTSTLPFFFSSFTYYFGQIRIDPNNENVVYALDIQLWRSTNGGVNFSAIGSSLHADQHALLIAPTGPLYSGNDGGFYRSTNGGSSFVHNETLKITQFYDLCIDAQNPLRRFGGTQDNGTLRTTTGGTSDWTNVLGGDGMQCEIDPTDSQKVYAESQWGGISRSVNGGDSFSSATSGIDPADRNNWVTPITHDPIVSGTLYTGTQRVYRSIDSAVSWTAISNNLSDAPLTTTASEPGEDHGQDPIQGTVTAIAVSPLDRDVIWAGTDDGNVWISTDFGSIWTEVTPPSADFWVTEIHPDPDNRETAYLTVAGYRSDDLLPYLRVTRDLGQTWETITGDLPQVPLNSVIRDPNWLGRLFTASDLGVHISEDEGASWSFLGDGMPFIVVQDLALDQGSRTLFAGSHARSLFHYDLTQLPPADGDGDGVDNNNDCALADAGAFASPSEVSQLTADRGTGGETILAWSDLSGTAGSGTHYDMARGLLSDLSVSGPEGAASLFCDLPGTGAMDVAPGPAADGFYYFIRGRNSCGLGPFGARSDGSPRTPVLCP